MLSTQDALAELFRRRGLNRHTFFGQPEPIILAIGEDGLAALEADDLHLAEEFYSDAFSLAKLIRLPLLQVSVANKLSGIMNAQGKSAEALVILADALDLATTTNDQRGTAVSLCNIGLIELSMSQYENAMAHLKQALASADAINDSRLASVVLINIGRSYSEMGLQENSIHYFREAGRQAKLLDSSDVVAACLLNEGDALLELHRSAEAQEKLSEALSISVVHVITHLETSALDSLGCYYEQVSNWSEAIRHHHQAHQLARSIDHAEGQLNSVLNLGRVNVDHGDPVQAAGQLHEALRLAIQLDRPKSRRDAHQHLARLYKSQGQLALALGHFESFHAEEQTLFSTERDKTTRTLMMQFDVERAQTQTRAEREQREHAETLQASAEAQVRQRTSELEQAQMEVVGRLAMAAEFRDDATGEHTRRVGIGAALIAEALGLSPDFTETLQIAARLHDVGKIGISDAVLLKAGKLSVAEYEDMKRHTLIGARLLSGGQSEVLKMARQIALTHHERWDGNGYPHGLAGSEIPLVGRIVALADVFDALMHKRPYKSAWEKAEALAELARQRGRHFDPELTEAALLVFGSGRYEAALLRQDQGAAAPLLKSGQEVTHWELEAMRLEYETLLEARTRELEAARAEAEVQVEELRRAAHTDALTGLHNRRAFDADLLSFAEQAQEHGRPLGVISLDLDGLKHVNDSGGHASGDALLASVARNLQRHFEPSGRVYRMGGDEYAVLLWSDPALVVRELAGEIRQLERELRDQGHLASLSAGYAHWPHDTAQPEHLLRVSDERMYVQKRRRKLGSPAGSVELAARLSKGN